MRKFVRTRSAPPAAAGAGRPPTPATPAPRASPAPAGGQRDPRGKGASHLNGHAHANGGGGGGGAWLDDSTLSRSGSARAELWEDPAFPVRTALGRRASSSAVRWMRPHLYPQELCTRPRFRGDDAPAAADDDGDCEPDKDDDARWRGVAGAEGVPALCVASAALAAAAPALLARLAPPAQAFTRPYRGRFRFRLWTWGEWEEVEVDDRLPVTTRGGRAAPLYSRGALPADFTLPLLEKAYAKLYGSYAAARSQSDDCGDGVPRALRVLSGGVLQSFPLRRQPAALTLQVVRAALPRSTLVLARGACGAAAGGGGAVYSIEEAAPPALGDRPPLLRVRPLAAPPATAAYAPALRPYPAPHPRLDAVDGQFWVSLEELTRALQWLELVHVGPDDWAREPRLRHRRPWRAALARRRWRPGFNDGGPPAAETTGINPQFHVQVSGARCHAVVALAQRAGAGGAEGGRLRRVGLAVYELPPGAPPARPEPAPQRLRPLEVAHEGRAREVATFFTLPAGRYLVVPHGRPRCRRPAAFLLRIFTDHNALVWEVNEDNVVLRDISEDAMEDIQLFPPEVRNTIHKILAKCDFEEVEAAELSRVARAAAGGALSAATSAALCALHDPACCGRVPRRQLPRLLARLAAWRAAYLAAAAAAAGRPRCTAAAAAPAAGTRRLLRAAGLTASNKVVECVVVRHARGGRLPADALYAALARLLLAHERYRALESKLKSNPLSLEEMILMTIYS